MTNGMPLIINAAMKPIPTLYKALKTVNVVTKEVEKASVERSDTTAIVPASIVIENVVAIELAKALTNSFNADNLARLQEQLAAYREELRGYEYEDSHLRAGGNRFLPGRRAIPG